MRILIVDAVCPKPYDAYTLRTEPLGGTEGTVVRLSEALASRGHVVRVTQHNRTESRGLQAEYTPFRSNEDFKPTHVIVLRAPLMLYTAQKQYPSAKLYFWAHDIFQGEAWTQGFEAIIKTNTVVITVSDWHRMQMYDAMTQFGIKSPIACRRIYNPIDDDLKPDGTLVDKNKLVFFSSPHKGLDYTLEVFKNFANFPELKDMKLYVANPGYFRNKETNIPDIVNLGALTHGEIISQVRSALAVFHLNNVYPETMGLVHAECNAVGTPFLSSRIGATPELCDHPSELIDVMDRKSVMDRIIQWKNLDRPRVRANANFRLTKIVKEWLELLSVS